MAIMTGLGALLGGVSNTQSARTGTTSTLGTSSNAGSSMPVFNPTQMGLQSSAAGALQNEMTNGIDTTPALTAGTDTINQTYKGIGDRLMQSLSSRGFGNSGASGTAALQTELGRSGAVGNLASQLQQYALGQQQNAIGMATNFGFAAPGSSTSSSSSGSQFGTTVNPGSVAAGTLSGGFTSILQQLNAAAAGG